MTLHACTLDYFDSATPGTCVMTTRTVVVGAGPAPTFTCTGGPCTVQAGLQLEMTANSAGSQHRYHNWSWTDANGNLVSRPNRDTNSTGFLSTEIFDANQFHVSGQRIVPVQLTACTGYSEGGSCVTATQNVTVTEPPGVEIACTGGSCSVPAGGSLELTGSSLGSRFRYHSWRWLDADYTLRTHDPSTTGTGFRSAITFDANGFSKAETITVELFACTGGSRSGSCVSDTIDVNIVGAPAPIVACGTTGQCTVQAGQSLALLGNSSNSRFEYHNWTWPNAAGDILTTELYSASSNFVTQPTFPASGFNPTSPQTVNVELYACKSSTRRGSCAATVQPVVIMPAQTPTITCDNSTCIVTAGQSLRLEGDGTNSGFRWHRWYWADGAGVTEPKDHDGNSTGGVTAVEFSAASFQDEATRDVTLIACSSGQEDGTCVRTTRRITVLAPPRPAITCSTGASCTVQAGQPIELGGNASDGRYPYHRWNTIDSAGALATQDHYTASTAFRSRFAPPTDGFTAQTTRQVELIACSTNQETGTCARAETTITITPAPTPSITCPGGRCEVQAGLTLQLRGDSAASRLRYHFWRWRDYEGTVVEADNIDVNGTAFLSTRDFSAADFGGAGTRTIELTACNQTSRRGTCVTREIELMITAPPVPEILCLSNPGCRVFAGATIQLTGQSVGAQYSYHQWRWMTPQGNQTYYDYSSGTTYRSTLNLATHGVSPSQVTRIPVELIACTRSSNRGSCTTFTREIVVQPVGTPRILCSGVSCTVAVGSSLPLAGTSSASALPYHRWTWRDHNDQIVRFDRSNSSIYLTQVTFSAASFVRPTARTVTLQACSESHGQGTCVETSRDITITNGGPARITCNPISCRAPAGSPITLTGDSSGPLRRYHRWTWTDPAGQTVTTDNDTGSGFISTASFPTAGFAPPHSQTVTLSACNNGFGDGACTNVTTRVGIDDAAPPQTSCEGGSCTVQAGHRIRIFADASNTMRRYHTYWYIDAAGLTRMSNTSADTSTWISEYSFDTGSFAPDTNRTVPVIVASCTSPWNSGTCSTSTQLVRITPAPLPTLACDPANCSVQAGHAMDIIVDSSASNFRYHTLDWTDALNRAQRERNDGYYTSFRTSERFDANYFSGASSRVIEVSVCENYFENGTCVDNSLVVNITAPPAPVIECSTGSACAVQSGQVMQMTGNVSGAEFQYQTWRWSGPGGVNEYHQRTGSATTFRAAQDFDTRGFQITENIEVEVELIACRSYYGSGTCVQTTRTVQVLAAPLPTITCNSASGCTVQAGQTLSMHGNSSNSQLRYHRWTWTDAVGTQQQPQTDVNSLGFVSAVTFDADDFQTATTRSVRLSACSDFFDRGTCVETTQTINVVLPPPPVVTCSSGATCEVAAGETIQLVADTSASQMRYHRWRWVNAFGSLSVTDRTPYSSGFVSTTDFSTHSFSPLVPRTITAELTACDENQDIGTCVRTTQAVRIVPVAPAVLACAGGSCSVPMGKTLAISGNSAASRLRYHAWVWQDGLNNTIDTSRIDTVTLGYQSAISFSADHFQGPATRSVTLYACSSYYRRGTCTTSTQQISITQAPLPTVTCPNGLCEVEAGKTIYLSADSSGSEFHLHTWRWTDATGRLVRTTNNTASTGYRSSQLFSAIDFNLTAPQTVTATLTACTQGYLTSTSPNGSCVERVQPIIVRPAAQTLIACENPNCQVSGGNEMRLTGTSSIARFRYHEWTWRSFSGLLVRYPIGVESTGYRSTVTFEADGFTQPDTRDVTLLACTDGYGAGSCSRRVQRVTILAAPDVSMRCNPPDCTMQPGFTIDVIGDTTASRLRYHRYRWIRPNGSGDSTDRSSSSFENSFTFNTTGYAAGDDPVITLNACSANYDSGTCRSVQQTITLAAPPQPIVTCDGTSNCVVQAGRLLELTGDASDASYRFHRWRWNDTNDNPISPKTFNTENTGYTSTTQFDARGYNITENVERTVTLNACHHSYDSGACTSRAITVTITPAPDIEFSCTPAGCGVITGQTIQVVGNSEAGELPYHTWTWRDVNGTQRMSTPNASSGNFRTSFSLNTAGFDPTPDYRVTLQACSNWWNSGTCVTREQSLGFRTPPAPIVTCDTGRDCEIQSGRTIQLTADSSAADFRYHYWVWERADGSTSRTNRDPGAGTFLTTEPIDTRAFEPMGVNIPLDVTVSACTGYNRTGTCVNTTQRVTILPPPATELTCTPDSCSVQAGLTLPMLGNSIGSQLRYHEWNWNDHNDTPVSPRRSTTETTGYRSAQTFSSDYFQGAATRTVRLSACADSYNRGTCANVERTVQITAAPAPTISCSVGASCTARPGETVQLVGSSANSQFGRHSWRLTRNSGNSSPQNNYVQSTGYLSTINIDTSGMDGNLLTNRGAEHSTSGWTTDQGILERLYSNQCGTVRLPRSGSYFFGMGVCSDRGLSEAHNNIDLTPYATEIDAQTQQFRWGGALATRNGLDVPEIELLFRDANGDLLLRTAPLTSSAVDWTEVSATTLPPVGTRSVDFIIRGTRNDGSDNDAYFDELFMTAVGEAARIPVELLTCTQGFTPGAGSCVSSEIIVNILPPDAPEITCDPANCRVQAGLTMTLTGDSSDSGYPYHRWSWDNAAGTLVQYPHNTASTSNLSVQTFDATAFQGAGTRQVTLQSCSAGTNSGTCVESTVDVTIEAPPAPTITCSTGSSCRLVVGQTMDLVGDSSASELRYHTWDWPDTPAQNPPFSSNSFSNNYISQQVFSALNFAAAGGTVQVTLRACSSTGGAGTCATTTQDVVIVPGGPASITNTTVTALGQPERAEYTFDANRPADWTIQLTRRVGGVCTGEVLFRTEILNVSTANSTWPGLSPGGAYCWEASVEPAGANSSTSGNFTVPTLPTFTAQPMAVQSMFDVDVTATLSEASTSVVQFGSGDCSAQQTALRFNGSRLVTIPGQVVPPDAFTVEAWMNLDGVANQSRQIFDAGGGAVLELIGGRPQLTVRTPSPQTLGTNALVPSTGWTHVAATFAAGSEIALFIDGIRVAQGPASGTNLATNAPELIIGADRSRGFEGQIASMAVYGRALGAAVLQAHALAGATGELPAEAGQLAAWHFSEAPGVQSVYDSSGNHNSGVLGRQHLVDGFDPTRRPAFTSSQNMTAGAAPTATLSRLSGGPAYCYRVVSTTNSGPVITSNLGRFDRAVDNVNPVVVAPVTTSGECNGNSARTMSLALPTVTDNADPMPTLRAEVNGRAITFPYAFPLGDTTVTWVARDYSGNEGRDTELVRVVDTTPPILDAGDNVTVQATSLMGAPFSPAPRTARDECGAVTVSHDGPANFPLGQTTVNFTAIDDVGRRSTDSYVVTVEDSQAPTFNPALQQLVLNHDNSACFDPTVPTPTVVDNAYAQAQLTVTGVRTEGPGIERNCWDLGTHRVTWTASDPANNRRTGVQVIVVRDASTSLNVALVGLEVDGTPSAGGRYYNQPVTVIFQVGGAAPPFNSVTVIPEPASMTNNGAVYRATYTAPGAYPTINVTAVKGGDSANETLDGFGIDTTPPTIDVAGLLDQSRVDAGDTTTWPLMFGGESIDLSRISATDGVRELATIGRAARFDGDDLITVPNPTNGFFASGDQPSAVSVETWVRMTGGDAEIFYKEAQAGGNGLALSVTRGALQFVLTTGGSNRSVIGPALSPNEWHHIVGTYDGRAMRLYVDGRPSRQRFTSGPVQLGNEEVFIGDGLNGDLAYIALWRTALTSAQVRAHYQGGAGQAFAASDDQAFLFDFSGTGQVVDDQTSRGNDGVLGETNAVASDDPSRVALQHALDGAASGLVTLTAQLFVSNGTPNTLLMNAAEAATGMPLRRGVAAIENRRCSGSVSGACRPGSDLLTANEIALWDGNQQRSYYVEVVATDEAGNTATARVYFNVRNYTGTLSEMIALLNAVNDGLRPASQDLVDAVTELEVARDYSLIARRYLDGSYLRAGNAADLIEGVESSVTDPRLPLARQYIARVVAADVDNYVSSLQTNLHSSDLPIHRNGIAFLEDARFAKPDARWADLLQLGRDSYDAVALLYPPYQPMRTRLRTAQAEWQANLSSYGGGQASAEATRTSLARINRVQQLVQSTRDLLRDVVAPEIAEARDVPRTPERRVMNEILDVIQKTSNAADEQSDLVGVGAGVTGCLDNLAQLMLDDREFTLCYLRLNDLAVFLRDTSEPLVHTLRWRTAVAVALFNMLELSLYQSPTGLPFVTTDSAGPPVNTIVLPDALAATVNGSTPVSDVDVDGSLAIAYVRHAEARDLLADGSTAQAFDVFIQERCLLVTMFNRYYSSMRSIANVADPKEAEIDASSVGCAPRGRSYVLDGRTTSMLPMRGLPSALSPGTTACQPGQVATGITASLFAFGTPPYPASLTLNCSTLEIDGTLSAGNIGGAIGNVVLGTPSTVSCPAGEVVVGIHGNEDPAAALSVGIQCAPVVGWVDNGDLGGRSLVLGQGSGTAFDDTCAASRAVTRIDGGVNILLQQITPTCTLITNGTPPT